MKYVGVGREDLIEVYILFIRSVVEYGVVVWHSRLTMELSDSLEMVQKPCLRVILGEEYEGNQVLDFCPKMPKTSHTEKNVST